MNGDTSVRPEPVEGFVAARGASTSSARTGDANALRFAGYAAIFNRIDKGGDIIRPGAFGAFPEGKSLPLLWQHDPRQQIGRVDHVREDRRGLRVIGSISTATRAGRDAAAGLASGAVKGLSFGYRVNRSSGQKPRELIDLDVAEISLVTYPMQQWARVHHLDGPADLT
ncbi:HK97 family phage prohead protease [Parasphingorhabdus sp.]|uniref:HK97 family phage prohead protease n=1 Tax=Parasphingorhabdus sp. TaxID=2709688 RepID=UPI003262D813